MFYILMFIYLVLLPIAILALLITILEKLQDMQNDKKIDNQITRKHPTIQKSNYDNAFGGRKAYEIYKNADGLYEPVKPSKGIELRKEE